MAKKERHYPTTIRVYDSGKKFMGHPDRYVLYFPYPKEWIRDNKYAISPVGYEHVGDFFAFSFGDKTIQRCYWGEWCRKDGYASNLGKRVKIDTLPKHVQKWIRGYQKVWTDYINHPDEEWSRKAWEKYN